MNNSRSKTNLGSTAFESYLNGIWLDNSLRESSFGYSFQYFSGEELRFKLV